MTTTHPIFSRLDTGRALLLGSDPKASLTARGVLPPGPAGLGRLVREQPAAVREHYHLEIDSGVDVLSCLTGDTIPRALQQIGMPFRAAALTGCAVDLALDAAELTPRPILVAGVLGTADATPLPEDRAAEELGTHAARLSAAGCELILAKGVVPVLEPVDPRAARISRRAAILSAVMTGLPTWAVVSVDASGFTPDGEAASECLHRGHEEGAQLVVFEAPCPGSGLALCQRIQATSGSRFGIAPGAAGQEPETWARNTRLLVDAGVKVVGGGPGTTHRHVGALASLLRGSDRQSLWPRAV